MDPEERDYQDDDDRDEFGPRSIFAAGWFRAVLMLTVLAILVVMSLPYLVNWFEPAGPAPVARSGQEAQTAPGGTPSAVSPPVATPLAPAATPPPAAVAPSPPPSKTPAPGQTSKPSAAPPAAAAKSADRAPATPATRKVVAEKPVSSGADKAQPITKAAKVAALAPGPAASAKPSAETAGGPGEYWVQLGAFKDEANAASLAKNVRGDGFPVQVTRVTRGGSEVIGTGQQQHELFVSGTSAAKLNAALKGKATAQPVAGGLVVRPAFNLQDAMTVSKRLSDDGFKVVIRPAGEIGAPAASGFHVVRAGGYSDRGSALTAREKLQAKGHVGFLTEGPAK